jgi:hypothetical protein
VRMIQVWLTSSKIAKIGREVVKARFSSIISISDMSYANAETNVDTNTFTLEIEEAHRAAELCGASTYKDPATGYNVFTKSSHLKRGKCCGSACRHCPFDHINVTQRIKDKKGLK